MLNKDIMNNYFKIELFCLIFILIEIISQYGVYTVTEDDWESKIEDNEKLSFEAIKYLHRQLDDNNDGNINLDESNEYLREELKYDGEVEKRQKIFHRNNDNQVTVRELWETWVKSEVHNWTVEQTIEWLTLFVALPQYTPLFLQNSINGTTLPRLAVNHQQFLTSIVGVKDMIHRQKISLKAQDVVLFGPPKEYTNYIKDIILTSLLIIAFGVSWNIFVRYKESQRELVKIMKHMEGLTKAEEELQTLQNVMEKNKMEREMSRNLENSSSSKSLSDLELPDEQVREEILRLRSEVEVLRSELQRAELELQDKCWVPPAALQHWLQLTYELELKSYNKKKQSAERQLRQAKEACDKLKRKRSSIMGAFVSTHGKSIDDVDKAILEAKGSLTEITNELQERMQRWKNIEILANCPIMTNPGLHYLETVLKGYGKASSYSGGPGSVISNSQDDIDDDAASSVYCPSAVSATVLPVSSSAQQAMMSRSKSVGSMLSLRAVSSIGGIGGRDLVSRDSTAEEDIPSEASEMLTGRRVTFGLKGDNRNAVGKIPTTKEIVTSYGKLAEINEEKRATISNCQTIPVSEVGRSEKFENSGIISIGTNTTEKPDLIKLSLKCKGESIVNPIQTTIKVQEIGFRKVLPNGNVADEFKNGVNESKLEDVETRSLNSRKVKFSEKVNVLKSISRFLTSANENIKSSSKIYPGEKFNENPKIKMIQENGELNGIKDETSKSNQQKSLDHSLISQDVPSSSSTSTISSSESQIQVIHKKSRVLSSLRRRKNQRK